MNLIEIKSIYFWKENETYEVTVQEVDEEYKKIILMMDLGIEGINEGDIKQTMDVDVEEEEMDKIEITKEVIDKIDEHSKQKFTNGSEEKNIHLRSKRRCRIFLY